MRHVPATAVLIAIVAGCGGETPTTDAGNGMDAGLRDGAISGDDAAGLDAAVRDAFVGEDARVDDAASLDAFVAEDAGLDAMAPPDAGPCEHWVLVELPLTALRVFGFNAPNSLQSLRIAADYELPDDCYVPAVSTLVTGAGASRVTVRAWRRVGGICGGAPRPHTRYFTATPARAGTVVDAVGGSVSVVVTLATPVPFDCGGAGRTACLRDCDCDTMRQERCLQNASRSGAQCVRPCEFDRECGSGSCIDIPAGPARVCDYTRPSCGAGLPACPDGYACTPTGRCDPVTPLSVGVRTTCACDSECAPGLCCVQGGGAGPCEIRCPSESSGWCAPAGYACRPAADDRDGLAAEDYVCGRVI